MATTPSGLSTEEAEALSKQQQEEMAKSMPQEGQVFITQSAGGGQQYGMLKGGKIIWLGYQGQVKGLAEGKPQWEGRNISYYQAKATQEAKSQLGETPEVLRANLDQYMKQQGWGQETMGSVSEFITLAGGTPASTTLGAASTGGAQQPVQPTQGVTYEDLVNVGGTIYNKNTGAAYGEGMTPEQAQAKLAADLNMQPHQIDWSKIVKSDTPPATQQPEQLAQPGQEPTAPSTTGGQQVEKTLVDIWTERADLQQAFPQGLKAGTMDNQKLNDWWNSTGTKEYPNVTLVQPSGAAVAPEEGETTTGGVNIPSKDVLQEMQDDEISTLVKQIAATGADFPTDLLKVLLDRSQTEAQRRQAIFDRYNITELQDKAFATPEETFETVYKRTFSELGLSDTKTDLVKAQDELDEATRKYNEAVSDLNENPWNIEAARTGKLRRLWEDYSAEATRLEAKISRLENTLERGKSEAMDFAQIIMSEVEQGRQRSADELEYFVNRAETDLKAEEQDAEDELDAMIAKYYPEYYEKYKDTANNQVVTLGGRKVLINTATGETIKDLGAASDTESGLTPYQIWQIEQYYSEQESEIIKSFYEDLEAAEPNLEGWSSSGYLTREELTDRLISKYPQLMPQDIQDTIFQQYPDLTEEEKEGRGF